MTTDYFLPADLPSDPLAQPVAWASWGGAERGWIVRLRWPLVDEQELVSDYGTRTTVAELRARDGRGRRTWPLS